jgi:hypothetical protein
MLACGSLGGSRRRVRTTDDQHDRQHPSVVTYLFVTELRREVAAPLDDSARCGRKRSRCSVCQAEPRYAGDRRHILLRAPSSPWPVEPSRLPREVLEAEVARIAALGVEFVLNHLVGDVAAEQAAGGFDAAFTPR